jgi:hypothetical protein
LERNQNIYDLLNGYLDIREGGINVLEEQINSEIQLEYFEYAKTEGRVKPTEEVFLLKDLIFDKKTSIDHTKDILVQLAAIDDIEAYRTLEKYLLAPHSELYEWAYLALHQNRLLLESKLLEENKVLITTGLGGKGLKLRYFIVFFTNDGSSLSSLQQKIIKSELEYSLSKNEAEVEDLIFEEGFASVLSMVPIRVPVQQLFDKVIKECNQFGDFLFSDYVITNVKVLSIGEVKELLTRNNIY